MQNAQMKNERCPGQLAQVFSNYRELVRPVDAEKRFGVTPEPVAAVKAEREKAGKIVAMPIEKAA